MTIELFRNDAYLKSYSSQIVKIMPDGFVLDKTIFYPEGGGQLGDTGTIICDGKKIEILGTRYIDNQLVHLIDKPN
jgi:Ser-tRNA(Ala) deacylase AlaX